MPELFKGLVFRVSGLPELPQVQGDCNKRLFRCFLCAQCNRIELPRKEALRLCADSSMAGATETPTNAPRPSHGAAHPSALGGSWVVISGVVSPLIWAIIMATLLITSLITTHEPPSRREENPKSYLPEFAITALSLNR